jgi:hypothetical protein
LISKKKKENPEKKNPKENWKKKIVFHQKKFGRKNNIKKTFCTKFFNFFPAF